jgi:hypothetical protein
MQRTLLCALIALASVSLLPHAARAQVIYPGAAFTNGEIEWGLRPDVPRIWKDGAPFSEKYNYNVGAPLMIGANPNQLWAMYYADRIERAQMFGYALPPGFDPQPAPAPPRPVHFGIGLGVFRWR